VYVYSKLFNHLTQCALEQVDTDEKKYRFMNDLSTKLQERLALNADWTFLELVSNTIVADDTICAHQERKKKKALATPSGSARHRHPLQQHHH
jgi:cell division protein FtsL